MEYNLEDNVYFCNACRQIRLFNKQDEQEFPELPLGQLGCINGPDCCGCYELLLDDRYPVNNESNTNI